MTFDVQNSYSVCPFVYACFKDYHAGNGMVKLILKKSTDTLSGFFYCFWIELGSLAVEKTRHSGIDEASGTVLSGCEESQH